MLMLQRLFVFRLYSLRSVMLQINEYDDDDVHF